MENLNAQIPPANLPADVYNKLTPGSKPPRRSRGLLWGLIGGLIVLGIGGGYLAHAQGWITIPFLPQASVTDDANQNESAQNTNQASNANSAVDATSDTNQPETTSNTNSQVLNLNSAPSANTNVSSNINADSAFDQMFETDRLGSCYLSKNHAAISYYAEPLRSSYQGYVDNPQSDSLCTGFSQSQLDQAGVDIRTDADRDGLNLLLERVYGASDASADTDGDTYGDVEEISNGYNPNGPGTLADQF